MNRWTGRAPAWVVALVALYVVVLVFVGAGSHFAGLLRDGLRPYDWAPAWLNLYWSSLAFLDSLAALLLLRGRRAGVDLMCAIMATDMAANWYAAYGIQHIGVSAQPGLLRLAAFTLFVLVTGPFARARLSPAHTSG
ncbi:hypothetical protein [Streptomyces sp. NPDC002403]